MKQYTSFAYVPAEFERERASQSYLMTLVTAIVGLPLPILNLVALLIFFVLNRKSTYFVRWHCTQALLSQLSLIAVNSFGFWWTISILFGPETLSNRYIAYVITLLLFNLADFIATIVTAIEVRKGRHVEWWLYGPLTHLVCKP